MCKHLDDRRSFACGAITGWIGKGRLKTGYWKELVNYPFLSGSHPQKIVKHLLGL